MDLPTAIGEFADMLTLGSHALERLTEHDGRDKPIAVEVLLSETQDIARRLLAIADELRQRGYP